MPTIIVIVGNACCSYVSCLPVGGKVAAMNVVNAMGSMDSVGSTNSTNPVSFAGIGRAIRGPVVVIDDSLTVRKIMEVALRREEMAALCFVDAAEALRVLKGSPGVVPSLIFLDVRLPNMNGYTLLRVLRSDPRFDDTPIILLSGQDGVIARLRGHLMGATAYMTKPFKTRDIVEVAARYIKNAS